MTLIKGDNSNVVSIGLGAYHKRFTLDEVNTVVRILRSVSSKVDDLVKKLVIEENFLKKSGAPEAPLKGVDRKIHEVCLNYRSKVLKLGGLEISGGFIVFISTDNDYWVWYTQDETCKYRIKPGETMDKIRSIAWNK